MKIVSRDNRTFKELLKLCSKKHRRARGLCIVEGEKIVREHLDCAVQVFVREGSGSFGFADEIILDGKLFDLVSGLENSSGALAVVPVPVASSGVSFPYLVLDGIQDSGNMGAILRSAAAFGFTTVFCLDCVDVWSQKVIRASAGVQFNLRIFEMGRGEFSKPMGSVLVAADFGGESVSGIAGFGGEIGLVLGSEGQGVSKEVLSLVDRFVTIPMQDYCESLNVAVAAGILMYEIGGRK